MYGIIPGSSHIEVVYKFLQSKKLSYIYQPKNGASKSPNQYEQYIQRGFPPASPIFKRDLLPPLCLGLYVINKSSSHIGRDISINSLTVNIRETTTINLSRQNRESIQALPYFLVPD